MCSSHIKCLFVGLALLAAACGDDNEQYRFGFNTTGIQFELFNETEGIHPSEVTLDNPRNPFREFVIGEDTKFDILDDGGNAAAFYAWATVLAGQPTGENQFYTATKLRDIFLANEVPEQDREIVRQMAIEGFQRVLDCFPNSVFFDVTGTFSRRLAPLAYVEILELGGAPQGDWILVQDSNGNPTAVRSTGFDTLAREILCF
jgi:hypothetical protein